MTTAPDLHVVFGTGPVGTTLVDELLARGKRVRLVNRGGKTPEPPPPTSSWSPATPRTSRRSAS